MSKRKKSKKDTRGEEWYPDSALYLGRDAPKRRGGRDKNDRGKKQKFEPMTCFNCGMKGHGVKECTVKMLSKNKPKPKPTNSGVYITGLPKDAPLANVQGALMSRFSTIGKVLKAKAYMQKGGGLKGDGLIIFKLPADADRAVVELQGCDMFMGHMLSLHRAAYKGEKKKAPAAPTASEKPKEPEIPSLGIAPASATMLFLEAFDPMRDTLASEKALKAKCEGFGPVASFRVLDSGTAVVKFGHKAKTARCIDAMHGTMSGGKRLVCDYLRPKGAAAAAAASDADKTTSDASSAAQASADSGADSRGRDRGRDGDGDAAAKPTVAPAPKSRSVVLSNVCDVRQVVQTRFVEQLERDFKQECSNYGPVAEIEVTYDAKLVVVMVSSVSAAELIRRMEGRPFDGRTLKAEYNLDFEDKRAKAIHAELSHANRNVY